MHERFTDRARRVMDLAVEEARRFRHEYVGTEHILLGLVRLGDGVAAEILRICGVSLAAVRQEIERIVQHGPGGEPVVLGKLPHTPRAATALQWAAEEARFLGRNRVDTAHLLVGLLHEPDGVAAVVLNDFGLTVDRARAEVLRLAPPPLAASPELLAAELAPAPEPPRRKRWFGFW